MFPQIPVGSGKNFSGVVDLITNQKLLWKAGSPGDDGRTFDSKPLGQSDEPELLQVVLEARAALIEQVPDLLLLLLWPFFSPFSQSPVSSSFPIPAPNRRRLIWMMNLLNCC